MCSVRFGEQCVTHSSKVVKQLLLMYLVTVFWFSQVVENTLKTHSEKSPCQYMECPEIPAYPSSFCAHGGTQAVGNVTV